MSGINYKTGNENTGLSSGHTDENGVFHWGSPMARAARIADEQSLPDRIAADENRRASLQQTIDQLRQSITPAKDKGFER